MVGEVGTIGEWAAAFTTAAAVWVAVRQPRETIRQQAAHAADLDAAQVVASYEYVHNDGQWDAPALSARVRVYNYGPSVLHQPVIEAVWSHGEACFLAEYGPPTVDISGTGPVIAIELHHLRPGPEGGVIPVGVDDRRGDVAPTLTSVRVRWRDRSGTPRETEAVQVHPAPDF